MTMMRMKTECGRIKNWCRGGNICSVDIKLVALIHDISQGLELTVVIQIGVQ